MSRFGLALLVCMSLPVWGQPQVACRPTVTGRVELIPLTSRVFKNQRKLRVWLPPQFDPGRKYSVLYILDGASAFDACTAFRHEEMRADETLTELITSGQIPALIAVGVDNGEDAEPHLPGARAKEFLPWADPTDVETRDPKGALFPDFLEKDVIPAVEAKYPVETGAPGRTLWGASYGGVAALNVLVRRPELFGRMIIESPSLQVGNGQLLRDTSSLVIGPARIAVGVGTQEVGPEEPDFPVVNEAILRLNRKLVENLRGSFASPQVQLKVAEGAKHNTPAFGARFADALRFVYGKK